MDMEQDCDLLMGGSTPDETSVLVTEPLVSAGAWKSEEIISAVNIVSIYCPQRETPSLNGANSAWH